MFNFIRTFTTKTKPLIHITDKAWTKMETIKNTTQKGTFLFAASSGGCSGLNYDFKHIDPVDVDAISNASKIPVTCIEKNNLKVFVDPLSEMYLMGTTIDYISEDYAAGIYENKFLFLPDKDIAGSCGCGISFYIKDAAS